MKRLVNVLFFFAILVGSIGAQTLPSLTSQASAQGCKSSNFSALIYGSGSQMVGPWMTTGSACAYEIKVSNTGSTRFGVQVYKQNTDGQYVLLSSEQQTIKWIEPGTSYRVVADDVLSGRVFKLKIIAGSSSGGHVGYSGKVYY